MWAMCWIICHMHMQYRWGTLWWNSMKALSIWLAPICAVKPPGPCLNIKTVFPMYGDSHVKDKTVGETVLSLTWEIPILVRRHLYIETAPWTLFQYKKKHIQLWDCCFKHKTVMRPSSLDTLRLGQNDSHFADDTIKCIFLNGNVWISSTQVSDSHLSPPGALQSRRASLQWT